MYIGKNPWDREKRPGYGRDERKHCTEFQSQRSQAAEKHDNERGED